MSEISRDTKKSDDLILNQLKKSLNIEIGRREKVMILEDGKLMEIYTIIERRKKYIYSLFGENFSEKEQEIKDEISTRRKCQKKKDTLNRIADNILNKRINKTFDYIMNDDGLNSWTKVVAMDRKLFINFLLEEDFDIENSRAMNNEEQR